MLNRKAQSWSPRDSLPGRELLNPPIVEPSRRKPYGAGQVSPFKGGQARRLGIGQEPEDKKLALCRVLLAARAWSACLLDWHLLDVVRYDDEDIVRVLLETGLDPDGETKDCYHLKIAIRKKQWVL